MSCCHWHGMALPMVMLGPHNHNVSHLLPCLLQQQPCCCCCCCSGETLASLQGPCFSCRPICCSRQQLLLSAPGLLSSSPVRLLLSQLQYDRMHHKKLDFRYYHTVLHNHNSITSKACAGRQHSLLASPSKSINWVGCHSSAWPDCVTRPLVQ